MLHVITTLMQLHAPTTLSCIPNAAVLLHHPYHAATYLHHLNQSLLMLPDGILLLRHTFLQPPDPPCMLPS
jgi:hypothetical protein